MRRLIINCLSFILFVTSTSCLCKNKEKENSTMKMVKIENECTEVVKEQSYSLPDIPINVNEVKQKFEKFTTSAFLNRSESKYFYKPDSIGFYGRYNLIGNIENEELWHIGGLIVFNNEKPWVYDNKSDFFIEIITDMPDLYVYDKINVGSDVSLLIQCLGKPKLIINDFYVYSDDTQNISIFEINAGKIKWIKI